MEDKENFVLSHIGQIAVTVNDMDKAIAYYRDCLGMTFLFQAPNVAFFDCDGIRLMLGQNEDAAKVPFGTVIYFTVEDIQLAFATLKERGTVVAHEPHLVVKMPDHELWMAFFRDPDGNAIGLMSRSVDR